MGIGLVETPLLGPRIHLYHVLGASSSLFSEAPDGLLIERRRSSAAQIRSVFRAVELSEGYTGYLATHEIYIYLLDTVSQPTVFATRKQCDPY